MKQRHIAIAGLLLPEVGAWEFSELAGVITGRRNDSPGVLQILHALQDTVPQPVTHDFCLSVLRFMLKVEGEPTDRQLMESVCGPYGAATFLRGGERGEVLRAWYCRRLPGVIYGVYSCPAESAHGPAYELVCRQCARIMSEVLFDRVSWGASAGEDPLTKVLLTNFERLENER